MSMTRKKEPSLMELAMMNALTAPPKDTKKVVRVVVEEPVEIPKEKKDYQAQGNCMAVYHDAVNYCTGFVEHSRKEPRRCMWWKYDVCAKCMRLDKIEGELIDGEREADGEVWEVPSEVVVPTPGGDSDQAS